MARADVVEHDEEPPFAQRRRERSEARDVVEPRLEELDGDVRRHDAGGHEQPLEVGGHRLGIRLIDEIEVQEEQQLFRPRIQLRERPHGALAAEVLDGHREPLLGRHAKQLDRRDQLATRRHAARQGLDADHGLLPRREDGLEMRRDAPVLNQAAERRVQGDDVGP